MERLKTAGYSTGHIYDTMQYISYLTPFNSEGLKVVLDEMTAEAGYWFCSIRLSEPRYAGEGRSSPLTVCNKDGIHSVSARVYIDGTGDGDVAAFAGAHDKGRESDGAAQPMTMNMKYLNVDTEAIKEHIRTHIEDFSRHQGNEELMDTVSRFFFCGFQDEFREAQGAGELEIQREDVLCFETDRPGRVHYQHHADYRPRRRKRGQLKRRGGDGKTPDADSWTGSFADTFRAFRMRFTKFTGPRVGVRGSDSFQ